MTPQMAKNGANIEQQDLHEGLIRTILAGSGRSLADAFANLEREPQVERTLHHPKRGLLGARITLDAIEGEGYWDLTRIRDDIYVVIANFAYRHPRVELVPGDGMVQFNFKIRGDMALGVSRTKPLRWNRPSLLVWAQPTGVNIREWTAPRAREQYVAISIRPEFLAEQFLASGSGIPNKLHDFLSNAHKQVMYHQLPLNAHTFELAMRLIENPLTDLLALVYTEGLTLQLLARAIASFYTLSDAPSEEYSERELRSLHTAKAALMRQFAPAPTIAKLARSVGLGESTLMRGFKAVFGETIFDFSLRCRMQHALHLLRDRRCSVASASEAVGYGHPTSFATAFRRHFGMRPIDVKRVKSR